MEITVNLDTIILYVQDVAHLKDFYTSVFNLKIIEEYPSEWVLLDAGSSKIGLHKIGDQYRDASKAPFKFDNNTKITFEIQQDLNAVRTYLTGKNVAMREIKTFENYGYFLCDGEDPEGNVFQLKQKK